MALRELLRLSYSQTARVMAIDPASVASLLARARLLLRAELRGGELPAVCEHRERALRILARRQDSEAIGKADDSWMRTHLAECSECVQDHAAMLEASACYRAWPRPG
jgi:hypothetical protein